MSTQDHDSDKPDKVHKDVTIYVNTIGHEWPKDDISYEQVVALALPTLPPGQTDGYTVLYQRAHGNKDGNLVAGQTVKVKEGMVFDVTATHLS